MVETIKYLWKEAKAKINGEKSSVVWYVGEGTSCNAYLWTVLDNVTCYIYVNKNGKYSKPTFSLKTPKYPYGSSEINYRMALEMAR